MFVGAWSPMVLREMDVLRVRMAHCFTSHGSRATAEAWTCGCTQHTDPSKVTLGAGAVSGRSAAAGAHPGGALVEPFGGGVPVAAGIVAAADGGEVAGPAEGEVLSSLGEEALDHQAGDARFTRGDPPGEFADEACLADVVLAAVAVAGVDDDAFGQFGLAQAGQRVGDRVGVVVRTTAPAAQDDVAVGVARGGEQRRQA